MAFLYSSLDELEHRAVRLAVHDVRIPGCVSEPILVVLREYASYVLPGPLSVD